MGTVAKVALGIIIAFVLLGVGCFVACGALLALGQNTQAEEKQKCLDLVEVEPRNAYTERNYAHVEGTISNRSESQTVRYVEIGVELLSGSGSVVASEYTSELNVGPGERRPFREMIRNPGEWSRTRVSVRECRLRTRS